jgi:hypothetical protein
MVNMEQLTIAEAASLVGLAPGTLRVYVARKVFPPPDGRLGQVPWWWRETVERWRQERLDAYGSKEAD